MGVVIFNQVDASRYLNTTYHIDPERIGLYGVDGGFITLWPSYGAKALWAGAALRASPTGRTTIRVYLKHPEFARKTIRCRIVSRHPNLLAEGLEDPLLMAHGMIDTNVHFQDIVMAHGEIDRAWENAVGVAAYPVETTLS